MTGRIRISTHPMPQSRLAGMCNQNDLQLETIGVIGPLAALSRAK
jgi:hypothetical protein